MHLLRKRLLIVVSLSVVLIAGGLLVGYHLLNSRVVESGHVSDAEGIDNQVDPDASKEAEQLLLAKDETLDSGFAVEYPKEWKAVHSGAVSPESLNSIQTDQTIITSPSARYEVVFKTQTNIKTTSYCTPSYITLKYLNADRNALPNFSEGRFVEYVVYFPSFNLYQYHLGLQKNTESIRGVTLESNTTCEFMFSEFIPRQSKNPTIPLTYTYLGIRPLELLNGENLKAGVSEKEIIEKLSGDEYEQAKTIVTSLRIQ